MNGGALAATHLRRDGPVGGLFQAFRAPRMPEFAL
jgi:hypothetical protein